MSKPKTILLILAFCLAGCGRKGPLHLEPVPQPVKVRDLAVRQIGSSVRLQWTMPERLSDDKTELDLKRLGSVIVRMSDKPLPPERLADKAFILARVKAEELQPVGEKVFRATCDIKTKWLTNHPLYFAVQYEWGRRRSPLSVVATLNALNPPAPIRDLRATREGKTIVLRWTPPLPATGPANPQSESFAGTKEPAGFDIYRSITGSEKEKEMRLLNDKPVTAAFYVDHDLGQDGEYHYQVTVHVSNAVESAFSNDVAIAFTDTFPPDTPRGLVVFSGRDHLLLSWEKVADSDLAGYRIYRQGPRDTDFQMLADVQTENVFRDTQVAKGKSYQYQVTAVDKKKNESPPSAAISQKFE
jgi:hypothetical protein